MASEYDDRGQSSGNLMLYDDRGYNESKYAAVQRQFRVKPITIYRNGDPFFAAKRYVINERQVPTWEKFLQQVSELVRPKNGYVERIYTPRMGHRVQSLDDLEQNGVYVAAGKSERFRPLAYNRIRELPPIRAGIIKKPKVYDDQDVVDWHAKKPATRAPLGTQATVPTYSLNLQPKIIHVYRNGDSFYPAQTVLLKAHEQQQWSTVLNAISEKVKLPNTQAIRKIFRMDGSRVTHVDDFENGGFYVAASRQMFVNVAYGVGVQRLQLGTVIKEQQPRYLDQPPTPPGDSRRSKMDYWRGIMSERDPEAPENDFYRRDFTAVQKRLVYDENGFLTKPVRFTKWRDPQKEAGDDEEEEEAAPIVPRLREEQEQLEEPDAETEADQPSSRNPQSSAHTTQPTYQYQ